MAVRFQSGIDYGQVAQGIEQDIQRAGQFLTAGVESYMDRRIQEQKYANTVLENIESLKEEGDLAHQKVIAEQVDKLYNQAKDNIYKYRTTKKGKVKFAGYDFDPETLRQIKNEARNIKTAALRSEQLRTAYDATLKAIANDTNIVEKQKAIDEANATFTSRETLFKGESINPDNPVLLFNKVIEGNVDPSQAVRGAVASLAGGKTTDFTYTLASGKSEAAQYNQDYHTPVYNKAGAVVNVKENENAMNALIARVYNSREGIAKNATYEQVAAMVREEMNPLRKFKYVEKVPEVKELTEADKKRLEGTYRYEQTKKVFDNIGRKISSEGEITKADLSKMQQYAGEDALKNVEIVPVKDIKSQYKAGESEISDALDKMSNYYSGKTKPVIDAYRAMSDTEKLTDGGRTLIKGLESAIGNKKEPNDILNNIRGLFDDINPLSQYVSKSYGYLIKDKRGEGVSLNFVENQEDWDLFGTSVYGTPTGSLEPVKEEQPKRTISGF